MISFYDCSLNNLKNLFCIECKKSSFFLKLTIFEKNSGNRNNMNILYI